MSLGTVDEEELDEMEARYELQYHKESIEKSVRSMHSKRLRSQAKASFAPFNRQEVLIMENVNGSFLVATSLGAVFSGCYAYFLCKQPHFASTK